MSRNKQHPTSFFLRLNLFSLLYYFFQSSSSLAIPWNDNEYKAIVPALKFIFGSFVLTYSTDEYGHTRTYNCIFLHFTSPSQINM